MNELTLINFYLAKYQSLFDSEHLFHLSQLSVDDQNQLKECLLMLIHAEVSDSLKRKVCDVVSELARNLIDEDGHNSWPEFLQFLFACASSPSPQLKECSLRMFS